MREVKPIHILLFLTDKTKEKYAYQSLLQMANTLLEKARLKHVSHLENLF